MQSSFCSQHFASKSATLGTRAGLMLFFSVSRYIHFGAVKLFEVEDYVMLGVIVSTLAVLREVVNVLQACYTVLVVTSTS